MLRLLQRATTRALVLLAALIPGAALAQFGVPAPSTPAPCPAFTGFPLALNLGSLSLNGTDGITFRCAFQTTQSALNTLSTQATGNAAAVASEVSRATAAEALLAPRANPIFTGTATMPSITLTGPGSTGPVDGTSVTVGGTTKTLAAWLPSFAPLASANTWTQTQTMNAGFSAFDSRLRTTLTWPEALQQNSTSISRYSFIATDGAIAAVFASQTADDPGSNHLGTIPVEAFANNNDGGRGNHAWGAFLRADRQQGANGGTNALELNISNLASDTSSINPDSGSFVDGQTNGIILTNGTGGNAPNAATLAMYIGNGSVVKGDVTKGVFNAGIIFGQDAIAGVNSANNGIGNAVMMGKGHQLWWSNGGGLQGAGIVSVVNSAGPGTQIRFQNGSIAFTDFAGSPHALFNHPAASTAWPVLSASTGTTPEVGIGLGTSVGSADLGLTAAGAGTINLHVASQPAGTIANFQAQRWVQMKVNGTVVYLPAMSAPW